MNKHLFFTLLIPFFIFLTACNEEDPLEKIHQHLEETVQIEKGFEENQERVFELEQKDEELYKEIIGLDSDKMEQVKELSEEAIKLLDERLDYVKLERTSLEESRVEFEKIEPLMEKMKDQDQKRHIEKMYQTMMDRYDAYEEVYEEYSNSIRLTKELYTKFQEETFKDSEVYSIIENVNESYDEVLKANESFNNETALYNSLKQEYYDMNAEK